MAQSIYRHFKATFEEIENKIEEIRSQILSLKDLCKEDILLKHNEEKIKELEDKLKDLQKEDVYLNFHLDDITYLKNDFQINDLQYIVLDETIDQIIVLLSSLFFYKTTSDNNKQIDQWNSSDNIKAKRRFMAFFPNEPIEYMKALKSRNSNRLTEAYTNERNGNKINNLHIFFIDEDLLNVYKSTETLIAHTPTEDDIKYEVENLIDKKLNSFLKNEHKINITGLITGEIILKLSSSTKSNEIKQEELEVLAESLDTLKSKHFRSEIKKLKQRGLSPEQIWDHII